MTEAAEDVTNVVPRLNDFRLLRLFRTAKERNKARYALAALMLIRLYWSDAPRSLKTLVDVIPGIKETKPILAEGKAWKWQVELLNKLTTSGMLSVDGDGLYLVTNERRGELAALATEPLGGGGSALKALLWPSDYAEAEEQEADQAVPADPSSGAADVLKSLTEALAAIVAGVQATAGTVAAGNDRMVELEKRIGAKVDAVYASIATIEKVASSFEAASAKYDNLIRLLEDDKRRQLAVISEKLQELSGRKRSVLNQLESVSTKEDELVVILREQLAREQP